jgi:hypothetical protein
LGWAFRVDGDELHLTEVFKLVTDIEEDAGLRDTSPNSKRKALYIALAKCAGWVRSYPTRGMCTTFAKCGELNFMFVVLVHACRLDPYIWTTFVFPLTFAVMPLRFYVQTDRQVCRICTSLPVTYV